MDRKTCIEILAQHNAWRRDDNIPNSIPMVNPTELGDALDYAIKFIQDHQKVSEMKSAWRKKNQERLKKYDKRRYYDNQYSINKKRRKRYLEDEAFREKELQRSREYRARKRKERMEKKYGPGEFDEDGKYIVFEVPDKPENEGPRLEQLNLFDLEEDGEVQETE